MDHAMVPVQGEPAFAQWWWKPRPVAMPAELKNAPSELSRRMLRCDSPGWGNVRDPRWADLAALPAPARIRAVQTYAALLASQTPTQTERLASRPLSERRWALSIASIQPLRRVLDWSSLREIADASLAWAELGFCIRQEFASLWSRLSQEFDPTEAAVVTALMDDVDQAGPSASPDDASMSARARRCWQLALQRSRETHELRHL